MFKDNLPMSEIERGGVGGLGTKYKAKQVSVQNASATMVVLREASQ